MPGHTPVLLSDVLRTFDLQSDQIVIDATLGGGGHARAMLARIAPAGRLLGLELDPRTLTTTADSLREFGRRVTLVQGSFRQLATLANANGFDQVDAILFDLGVSSMTLDDASRGFSFQANGPLDMRFDPDHQTLTAADLLNDGTLADLTTIIKAYGEEPAAARVAAAIVDRRRRERFADTADLAEVVSSVVRRRGPRHPATKTFQALRMAVNDELNALLDGLNQSLEVLKPGGRLGVITFHSLEDRIVKRFMRDQIKNHGATLIAKVKPPRTEILSNPRSRSALLRILSTSLSTNTKT